MVHGVLSSTVLEKNYPSICTEKKLEGRERDRDTS